MNLVAAASDRLGRLAPRPETAEDESFVFALYASTRAAEMALTNWTSDQKHAFLRWQFELQRQHYRLHYADAAFDVLMLDDVHVGRMYVSFRPDEIRLMEITIDPRFRGRGIATHALRTLLDNAQRKSVPVTLHVEPDNPAVRLYERLGFSFVEHRGIYQLMEWRPLRQT